MAQITVEIHPTAKKTHHPLSQDMCMDRPPKMAVLVLCTSPAEPEAASPIPPHMTDLPIYLLQASQLMTALALNQNPPLSLSKGQEEHGHLLVSMVTNEPTVYQFSYNQ